MIVIIDYGMGNLRSAQKGFEKAGHEAIISDNPADIESAAAVVLPGVGAYADCYAGLEERGFIEPVKEAAASGKPFMGICVGMQMLFESSEEGDCPHGLGILPGRVVRFPHDPSGTHKVPHMGWNRLTPAADKPVPLLEGLDDPYVYFVHSYYPEPSDPDVVLATAEHGVRFAAVVGRDNVIATQFHPEKSQQAGISILRAFGNMAKVTR